MVWGPLVEFATSNGRETRLAAGTVSFLLADVHGSARLADTDPGAVSRCTELLADAVARHDGVIVERRRDLVLGAFSRASDAAAAALGAQSVVGMQTWAGEAPVRVRAALHTAEGQAREHGSDFSQAVARCARLRAIAHGGQTLLSRATRDLVIDNLPDGAELVDLGVHRLRDLGRPERVYGLTGPSLGSEFPPLCSLGSWPNNLPEQFTSFVGRERELDEVCDVLSRARLVVLTGAGGGGKTRLALQAAAENLERSPDGAWLVELASLTDGELIAPALADAVGVRTPPGRSALEAVIERLAPDCALVLLDNCEHLIADVADVCAALMRGCPQLTLLATSRAPLGVAGEVDWRVPPLSLPAEHPVAAIDALAPSDAVALFIERAIAVRPKFSVDRRTAPAIAQICHDLDGIPLAIELAAARVRVLSPAQIADGLSDRFRLLTGGARGAMPRQQTLRASVDWSYELLTAPERLLFRRLAVFAGGFSLEAAEAVCADEQVDRGAMLDLVTSLVDKSLVSADDHGEAVRYRILETIREYGLDLLDDHGELNALRARHLKFFLALAERASPRLLTPDQPRVLKWLGAEAANLIAAVEHAVDTDPQRGLELCAALTWWWMSGRLAAGELSCGRALAVADPEPSSLRAQVTWARAMIARESGEYVAAYTYASEALALGESVEDRSTTARALVSLSALQLHPDPVASRPMLDRAIELASGVGDEWALAHAICSQAMSHLVTDDLDEADRLLEAGLPQAERIGAEALAWYWMGFAWSAEARADAARCFRFGERAVGAAREIAAPIPEALAHCFMGWLEIAQGRPELALQRLRASESSLIAAGAGLATPQTQVAIAGALAGVDDLRGARELLETVVAAGADQSYNLALALTVLSSILRVTGNARDALTSAQRALEIGERAHSRFLTSESREALGRLAVARGDYVEAEALLQTALAERVQAGLRLYFPQTFDALAQVAAGLESYEEAARLLGAAERVRTECGLVRWRQEQPEIAALQEALEQALGAEAYQVARAAGVGMTTAEATVWIQRARGKRKRPASGWESLTPTELQVVSLVAEGLTNPQIAERMFISRATVKVHLSHIFQKLSVRTRAELTAMAVRRLIGP